MTGQCKATENQTTNRPNRSAQLSSNQILELIAAGRVYYPPTTGLHICGSDDVHNAAVTVAALPMDEETARFMYDRTRIEFEDPGANELVVDLMVGDHLIDNFSMRRQMVDRFRRECGQ